MRRVDGAGIVHNTNTRGGTNMPDAVVHVGENSPEHVAYRLMRDVANLEGRSFARDGQTPADRQWLLDTYGECLEAARGLRGSGGARFPSRPSR